MTQQNTLPQSKNSGVFSGNFLNLTPFICSLLVIIIHQHNTLAPAGSWQGLLINFFAHGLGTAAVPMFMVMSGYLFFRNADSCKQVFRKQTKRILTVLVPFLVWSLLYYALYAVGSIFLPGITQAPVDISFGGIVRGIVFYEYVFPMWYMFQLCVYIALTPVIFMVLKNKAVAVTLLVLLFLLGISGKGDITITWNGLERNLFQTEFFTYFLFGSLLARRSDWEAGFEKFAKGMPWVVAVVAFVAVAFLESLLFNGVLPVFNERILVPLLFLLFFMLAVKISQSFPVIPKPRTSTMILDGVHPAIGIFLYKLLLERLGLPALGLFVASVVFVTLGSFVATWIIGFIKPVHRILSGNR